jgi:quercetin dioxygenase-like cupin family protein
MNKNTFKPMLAGVFVACAFGVIALGIAWATPALGISTTIVSGPTVLEEVNVHTHSDIYDHAVKIKTKGLSDIYTVYNTILPGGHTGWHSHPGPSIISVKSGVATEYHADDPNTPEVHPAGTSFVDDGEGAHLIRNEGTTNLELVAFQILPAGAPRRIDQPAP